MEDQQAYYILNTQTSYETQSVMGPITIVVEKGELFQPILDDPTNFTNGFTILKEEFLQRSPLFDKAYKLKTIEMKDTKIDTTGFPESTQKALKESGHAEESVREQFPANVEDSPEFNEANELARKEWRQQELLALQGVTRDVEDDKFKLLCLENYDHSNVIEAQQIFDCSDEQFDNYLEEFKSTVEMNIQFVKQLEEQDDKTPIAPKPTQDEVVKAYVNDPEVKANHVKIATQLREIFKDGWFSTQDITKKTSIKNIAEATQMMIGVQLFQLCTTKTGGIKNRHQTMFKITLSAEERLKVLEGHKINHLKQIELINKEMEKLTNEIAERE